jgi:hypothetical protein
MRDALVYTIPRSKTDVAMPISVGGVDPVGSLMGVQVGTFDGGPVDMLYGRPMDAFDGRPDGTVGGTIFGGPVGSVGVVVIV